MLYRIINTPKATIYLWHITENATELGLLLAPFKDLALHGIEQHTGQKLWHNTHFLSTRILVFKYAALGSPILKNEFGKPFLFENNISITHSNDFTAIIVSHDSRVAIDLEKIDTRILRVAHKFINEKEIFFDNQENTTYNTLIWSAKETMYKLYSANEVIFKEELLIHPFTYTKSGKFIGDILKNPSILNIELFYFTFENYVLTWCEQ